MLVSGHLKQNAHHCSLSPKGLYGFLVQQIKSQVPAVAGGGLHPPHFLALLLPGSASATRGAPCVYLPQATCSGCDFFPEKSSSGGFKSPTVASFALVPQLSYLTAFLDYSVEKWNRSLVSYILDPPYRALVFCLEYPFLTRCIIDYCPC